MMLDESMFQDIQELAENNAFLKVVEDAEVSLEMLHQLPPYSEVKALEQKLKDEGKITFTTIFHEPSGYHLMKCFLISDYAVDKAIFIKDCEAYRAMRFESARRKVAKLLYQRFVALRDLQKDTEFPKGSSVFEIIKNNTTKKKKDEVEGKDTKRRNTKSGRDSRSESRKTSVGSKHDDADSETEPVKESEPKVETRSERVESILEIGTLNNPIGVYGAQVTRIQERVEKGEAPNNLFDEAFEHVMNDLKLDVFPRFMKSEFYEKYIRTKWIESQEVTIKDFTTFRLLGRGGFGAVHACRKKNSGAIYAMKSVNKKLVKVKTALVNVMEERNVLTMLQSKFVTNLKYALQDEDTLYLIMDLMLGGDLKYHLINTQRFPEKRACFYAAEILLGLERIHSAGIIYRDLKLENVLLDRQGHCRLSDLGLAVVTDKKVKGYAGTPGYTAPEMINSRSYGPSVDIFSFGVLLYRMLCGSKPFKGKNDRELDKAVLKKDPTFPKEIFSDSSISLLTGLLQKRPENRLGCGRAGIQEIKDHAFFETIDWGLLEAGYIDPPFIPDKNTVNCAPLKDIGDFDRNKYKDVKLDEKFKKVVKSFDYISVRAIQEEMVKVLEKADENVNYEKFSPKKVEKETPQVPESGCCSIS